MLEQLSNDLGHTHGRGLGDDLARSPRDSLGGTMHQPKSFSKISYLCRL